MILALRVRDLATVAEARLELGPGLNVLTGETGAGKSMLVDALGLLVGGRADATAVRPGAARAVIEAVVEGASRTPGCRELFDELGLDLDDEPLVLRREVGAEGRSRGWIGGQAVPMATLSRVGELLVDLHGQHETRTVVDPERQRALLDAFASAESLAAEVREAWNAARVAQERETSLRITRDEITKRAAYLRHLVQEVDAANLVPGEDEALAGEARRLGQVEARVVHAQHLLDLLDGEEHSAVQRLADANRALAGLERLDADTGAWRELLDTAHAHTAELARTARDYLADTQHDPQRLVEVEARRDLLSRMTQKYGSTVEAVLQARADAAAELAVVDDAEHDLQELARAVREAEEQLDRVRTALTAARRKGATQLARAATRLLPALGLPGGRLEVELTPAKSPGSTGAEDVRFLVQLNAGLESRPLARVASGGEISRVMLALKAVLARHDRTPVLVFDEIDQGIGGEVGAQVAAALRDVAARHQVLVITHLPQIAARADHHLVVRKAEANGIATSTVARVDGEARIAELARMLGDPSAATARRHAEALLNV